MKLSKNFELIEFTQSQTAERLGLENTPDLEAVVNLTLLCANVLQPAREQYGKPIIVSSGFRSLLLNKEVGGKVTSQHLSGKAADLQTADPKDLMVLFRIIMEQGNFDQLIIESKGATKWIHVSYNVAGNRGTYNNITIE